MLDYRLAELRSIEGAEDFSYDESVPYDRLDDKSIATIEKRAVIPEIGVALINSIRNSEPDFGPYSSREFGNIIGVRPSRIMRLTQKIASLGVQYFALLYVESPIYTPRLLEVWDSVNIPDVEYKEETTQHKGKTTHHHRVHALLAEPDCFDFFEYRIGDDLRKKPALYHRRDDGRWDSKKLRDAAAQYGIGYRLVTDEDFGQVARDNLSDLKRVYERNFEMPSQDVLTFIVKRVEKERVVSWQDLNNDGISGEAIKTAIALQLVWYPIREWDMSLEAAFVYVDEAAYREHRIRRDAERGLTPVPIPNVFPAEGESVEIDGVHYTVVRADEVFHLRSAGRNVYATRQEAIDATRDGLWRFSGQAPALIYSLPEREIEKGCLMLAALSKPNEDGEYLWPCGKKKGMPMSLATVSRKKAAIHSAEASGTSPLIALASKNHGNGGRHTFGESLAWENVVNERFLTGLAPTAAGMMKPYLDECERLGVKKGVVSDRMIRKRVKALNKCDVIVLQKGSWAAYKYGNYVPIEKVNLLIKGRNPGEVGHCDSTPIPNVSLDPFTQQPATRRVSLTLMVDANDDNALGYVMYYGNPSHRAIFQLLRKIVHEHGYLPAYIVFDRGPEHISRQLAIVLARFGVILLYRPVKKPRAGTPVETKISSLVRGFFRNLPGYRNEKDNIRELQSEFRPRNRASMTLTDFRRELTAHLEAERARPSTKTGSETVEKYEQRREFAKGPAWVKIKNVPEFIALMMPLVETGGGTRKVEDGCIRNQYMTYSAPELQDPKFAGKSFKVHEDTDNLGHVFLVIEDRKLRLDDDGNEVMKPWIECKCLWYDRYSVFTADEREEYFEHKRRLADTKEGHVAMPEDKTLVDELEAWRLTPPGTEAHLAALQNQGIKVDRAFLVEKGFLNPDGTVCTDPERRLDIRIPRQASEPGPEGIDSGVKSHEGSQGKAKRAPREPKVVESDSAKKAEAGVAEASVKADAAHEPPPPPKTRYVPKLLKEY